ncbi:MAG TPA: filamentous hemagglutinin family protein, partial [Rhizomicrobium sp.]|nr:filamentous hemagglutinin family protein [Rhizomicrobium sp.]
SFGCNPYGPLTQAAYPVDGGHLTLTAQRDIIGYEHPLLATAFGSAPNQQYFAPWLLAQGTSLSSASFGAFAPLSGYLATGQLFTPSQTSWWINFGSFDQGLMSVGGDVTVKAGRDIQELSVSLPTTARVSGGLSSTITDAKGNTIANIPVVHLNGSGDMTVIAGRDIKSGAYYEGSGDARILAGGSVSSSWSARVDPSDPTITSPVSTVLAVDTGRIVFQARGDIAIAGIVSGPSLQNVADADTASPFDLIAQSVSGYGQSSAVSLLSVGGDLVMNDLTWGALTFNAQQLQTPKDTSGAPDIGNYPASFRAVAANGDVTVKRGFKLAASQNGTLELLAHGSLLTSVNARDPFASQPISTGPSLVEATFDAVNPLAGFAPALGSPYADLGSLLLHQNDTGLDLFYAATGDIIATGDSNPLTLKIAPLAWEITKPAKVQAARDIIDLSFFGQNLAPTDVTSIVAGRDILYTGAWQAQLATHSGVPDLKVIQNLGGLSLAGPGFFEIQAGRNLGPFVTAAADIVAAAIPVSNPIGTGIVTFGNTVVVGNRRAFSSGNPSAADPFALGANNKLARRGADIVALFGVANGIDYASVIHSYVDPATSTSPRDYIPALQTYLQTLGYGALSRTNAWTAFTTLPAGLQEIFADKVFLSEIKLPGNPDGCCYKDYAVAYSMINTLFPASLGYTDNNITGSAKPVLRATGNVDLLHATIKTLQSTGTSIVNADGTSSVAQVGGDIMLLGPGGSIDVGTTALEVNRNLSNSSLGILTLNNGAINVFTDANVLVNQSRILTVQGGDIMMFSSNGDLDAGRGAKTTVDFKPLSVIFDPADLQTINLNGLVSGAGIGTIRSTPDAPAASAALIAPRGTVNAGDAGLRSSGNLDIVALLVLNAANVSTAGRSTGLPDTGSANIGALESTSSTGGQAARIADDSVAAAANRGAQAGPRIMPALVTVEVLGFGDCDPESGRACAAH